MVTLDELHKLDNDLRDDAGVMIFKVPMIHSIVRFALEHEEAERIAAQRIAKLEVENKRHIVERDAWKDETERLRAALKKGE